MKECDTCKTKKAYIRKYDSFACLKCDAWHDSKCSDVDCEFCSDRPEKPSEGQNA